MKVLVETEDFSKPLRLDCRTTDECGIIVKDIKVLLLYRNCVTHVRLPSTMIVDLRSFRGSPACQRVVVAPSFSVTSLPILKPLQFRAVWRAEGTSSVPTQEQELEFFSLDDVPSADRCCLRIDRSDVDILTVRDKFCEDFLSRLGFETPPVVFDNEIAVFPSGMNSFHWEIFPEQFVDGSADWQSLESSSGFVQIQR
ncbi:MAG: uncharacterized protein KVP18_000569 [Porospora cf. gigantea A]|uniref:uncharacterized protein n=1 Tax=Porospora cf. gigantea A TaxID=2853593 RepID=UPI00355A4E19|nr:MAG: hypothetical protein KVP18_000569 [Porospora cf. gigantea A]